MGFSGALVRYQSSISSVFGGAKTGFHCNKYSFRAEKDKGYEHVPSSNIFCGLYQYILNREINAATTNNLFSQVIVNFIVKFSLVSLRGLESL